MRLGRSELLASALAAALLVTMLVRCLQLSGAWLPALDDALIHSACARQLAEHRHWGLAAEHRGGETSPGFALLLAAAEIGPWRAAPQFAVLLGYLAFCALPLAVHRLFARGDAAAGPAMWMSALGGTLLFHAQSGMETMPYLVIGCFALGAVQRGQLLAAGLLAGTASWLRLDAWALWLALVIAHFDRARAEGVEPRTELLQSARLLLPGALLALAAPLWLALAGGDFPPPTLGGRRWLIGLDPQWHLGTMGAGMGRFVERWIAAFGSEYGFGSLAARFAADLSWARWLRGAWKLAALTMLAFGTWRLASVRFTRGRAVALPAFVLWSLATLLQYCVLLPARGHAGRYQPQLLLCYLLCVAIALAPMWRARWLRPVCAIVILGVVGASFESVRLAPRASAHLHEVHARAAREIPTLEEQRIAVFDIGWWAYLRDDAWIDISGLADPGFPGWIERGELADELRGRGATHVLIPLTENDGPGSLRDRLGLSELDGVDLQPVASWETDDSDWAQAFQLSGNAARRLVLYRFPS